MFMIPARESHNVREFSANMLHFHDFGLRNFSISQFRCEKVVIFMIGEAKIGHTFLTPEGHLEVAKPAGVELIKCFGASRDITRELPQNLRGRSLNPMAKDVLNNASKLFSNFSKSGNLFRNRGSIFFHSLR